MPLQATSGAASYDAFGGGVAAVPNYIEDVFSTYLIKPSADYTTYSINNGIDLSTKGGMTWFKARDAAQNNLVYDTARGSSSGSPNALITNSTAAQQTAYFDYVTPNTNGFTVNYLSGGGQLTNSGINYVSWTFREQDKFHKQFLVSHTNGTANNIDFSALGTVGYVHAKITSTTGNWTVWHRSLTAGNNLQLNTTAAQSTTNAWLSVSGTTVTLAAAAPTGTYIVQAFAHNAGGFGLTGTDNVISCGSYATDSSYIGPNVNLGYEPQWILVKNASANGAWYIIDNMRGWESGGNVTLLNPNSSAAESTTTQFKLNATGFQDNGAFAGDATMIYIAIRRGPMKVPTDGTKVFKPVLRTTSEPNFVTNFVVDSSIYDYRPGGGGIPVWTSRLLGGNGEITSSTGAEVGLFGPEGYAFNTGVGTGNPANSDVLTWNFQRAPGFFDEVCYTGNGTAGTTVTHNLDVVPELMIVKSRSGAFSWQTYHVALGPTKAVFINANWEAFANSIYWNDTAPTDSNFTLGGSSANNGAGVTYVSYLFATCPGVSKVGSYTGTGTTQQINCGFTAGARFVLIKRTDATGDWYVWDSARGIVAGNDPYLLLNSTAAEVTSTDYVDTYSAGFEISSTAPAAINASGGTFIFLAIA